MSGWEYPRKTRLSIDLAYSPLPRAWRRAFSRSVRKSWAPPGRRPVISGPSWRRASRDCARSSPDGGRAATRLAGRYPLTCGRPFVGVSRGAAAVLLASGSSSTVPSLSIVTGAGGRSEAFAGSMADLPALPRSGEDPAGDPTSPEVGDREAGATGDSGDGEAGATGDTGDGEAGATGDSATAPTWAGLPADRDDAR